MSSKPEKMAFSCPGCGKVNDRHSDMTSDAKPKHGDVSICIDCGQLSVFDLHERCLRLPRADELREFEQDPRLRMYMAAWRAVVRKTPN